MPISVGSRLGPYVLSSPLGAGGMGEVYRAHDTRLGRDVAVKVLPADVAADAGRRARFEHEARAVAALSHPGLLTLHDIGTDDGRLYLVTELVEGETLRQRLARGPLPIREAVDLAAQLAEALAAAHAAGITHRDLKPENVMVTADGRAKVLDFGLAKTVIADAHAATVAGALTEAGTVLGTVGYMAPEQVRAQAVDARTDLFALGVVLHELLAGQAPFARESAAETMSAIAREDPAPLPDLVPAGLRSIVARCTEKSPAARFQSAQDLAFALRALSGSGTTRVEAAVRATTGRWRGRRSLALAGGLAAALAAGAWLGARWASSRTPPPAEAPMAEFTIDAGFVFPPRVVVSPDGRIVAYNSPTAASGPLGATWLRRLDSVAGAAPSSTKAAEVPIAWSPDSRHVLAYSAGRLVAIDVVNEQRRSVVALPAIPLGVAWLGDGSLLMATGRVIARLPPGARAPEPVTRLDPARDEWHAWPVLLPGEKRFLYLARKKGAAGEFELRLGSLDDGRASGLPEPVLMQNAVGVQFQPPDLLLFVREQSVLAQRLDVDRAALVGEPVRLASDVADSPGSGTASLSVSATVLAFRRDRLPLQSFAWLDRDGRLLERFPKKDVYTNFDLAPDGQRLAVTSRGLRSRDFGALWLLDFSRGLATDISERSDTVSHSDATWSPDGTRLAFRLSNRLVIRAANGGPLTTVLDRVGYPETWSPDGRHLIAGVQTPQGYQLWTIDLAANNQTTPLVTGEASLDEPHFSPNGRWVAYNGSDDGRPAEVYAVPFPPTGERYQLSRDGGTQPRWRRDGEELYYLAPDGALMAVRVPGGDPRRAQPPALLFQTGLEVSSSFDQYAPAPDGRRFLLRRPEGVVGDRSPVHVIINWRARLAAGGR